MNLPENVNNMTIFKQINWLEVSLDQTQPDIIARGGFKARDLRSFEIQFEFESTVRFDSKGISRFETFQIESAVPTSLLVVSLVKRLKPLTALCSGTVSRLDSSMSHHTPVV